MISGVETSKSAQTHLEKAADELLSDTRTIPGFDKGYDRRDTPRIHLEPV